MDAAFSNASDEAFYCMVSDAAIKQLNPICYSCISCIMMVRCLLIWFICDWGIMFGDNSAGVMLLRTTEGQPYGGWHFTKIMILLSARF